MIRHIRNYLFAIGALVALAPAAAHDFWLQPMTFRAASGQPVPLRILIGEPDAVEHWETEWRKIVAFQDFGPTGVSDQLATISPLKGVKPTLDRQDAVVRLATGGTHMLAFVSNQSLSDLPADKFNAYAEHEGLALALDTRKRTGATNTNGRELYSRRAKALVQVGSKPTSNVTVPIGQTLEIVPDKNPYSLRAGEPLRLRIWFHGAPLAGASVVLERLGKDAVHGVPIISDTDGYVAFRIGAGAAWKANVVWSDPIVDPRADFETIFCSLTFGAPTD